MVLRPQSHRKKVLLPVGAQNFGCGLYLFTLNPEGEPAEILNPAPPRVRVRGYRQTSPRASLSAP
jgi:hypothetical protein